ncbi:helix-turn-helix domain-containing protein [Streptomyces noursei]|uniref:helix-turn-helix domain-containing protein n=1 Tax=Streptomyces noursei TaxID=1971 RepID=UPI003630F22F
MGGAPCSRHCRSRQHSGRQCRPHLQAHREPPLPVPQWFAQEPWQASEQANRGKEVKKRFIPLSAITQETRLFIAQGFEEMTIPKIAVAARIANQTVSAYFARKEDLALDHQEEFEFTTSLAHAVATRHLGESALVALRRSFADATVTQNPMADFVGSSRRTSSDSNCGLSSGFFCTTKRPRPRWLSCLPPTWALPCPTAIGEPFKPESFTIRVTKNVKFPSPPGF